jgi:hypothetical protein
MQERHAIAFLKMAAIELRKIADAAPDVADRILQMVQQIEAEVADMERRSAPAAD